MDNIINLEIYFQPFFDHEGWQLFTRTSIFIIDRSLFLSRYLVNAPFSTHGHTIAGMSGFVLGSIMVPNNGKTFRCFSFDHTVISLRNS